MREFGSPVESHDSEVFKGFFVSAGEAMLILDEAYQVVQANAAALRLFARVGLQAGTSLFDAVEPASRRAVQHLLDMTGTSLAATADAVIVGGERDRHVPIEITASPFTGEGSNLVGVVVRDRSDVVEAASRLQDREEQYRTLFMRAPLALREEDFSAVGRWLDELRAHGVVDLDAYLTDHPEDLRHAISLIKSVRVNPACVELLKADSEAQVLSGFRDIELTPDVVDSMRAQFLALWRGDTAFESEFTGENFKGEPFECRIHWTVRNVGGRPDLARVVVGLLDISAIRAAQQRLEGLIEDKDRFIASVSHELRTPLAAVFGLASELEERWDTFSEDELRSLVEVIAGQSSDLTALVEDLLLAAKLEMGEVRVEPEIVDLLELTEAAADEVKRSDAPLEQIDVVGEPQDAFADPSRTRQVIRNLLTNAARYGGPRVHVTVGQDGPGSICVRDNGGGLPEHEWERIFDPYHRATAEPQLGSLGLGLTISRQLARAMGGDITYRYQMGESIFTLQLPVADAPIAS